MSDVRTIAFYLPQYYPTPENDEWWGKGFTEWTNVAKAKPLFKGHYQPRVPSELGFYDLRIPSVREQQVELAKIAGIDGFCYWHYWFSGRRLLDQVFSEVVASGKPEFPFCLCWANHSWCKKDFDDQKNNIILIEQLYPGEEDIISHFYAMLPAFRDDRYIKVDGRLLFGIFNPFYFPIASDFFRIWNKLAKENGLPGFYFFGLIQGHPELTDFYESGYDAIVLDSLADVHNHPRDSYVVQIFKRFRRKLFDHPYTVNYDQYVDESIEYFKKEKEIIPCISPDFDHSPRSGNRWIIVEGSTPEKWGKLYERTKEIVEESDSHKKMIFIKSWNEWGEGNYLEPDLKYGRQYIEEMSKYK